MAMSFTLSAVRNLRSGLQSSEVRELMTSLGYKSEVGELEKITTMLQNADFLNQNDVELTKYAQERVDQVRDAIYDADDLIDRLVIVAESMHMKNKYNKGYRKLAKMMRLLCYRLKGTLDSSGAKPEMIRLITQKLSYFFADDVVLDRRESAITPSLLMDLEDVIGRDGDKEKILPMLLLPPANPNVTQDGVSFLSIVGIVGSGKTTLTRLIFNDHRIQEAFSQTLWVDVGIDGPHHFNIKSVLSDILKSATPSREYHESTPEEELAAQIPPLLVGNRYLVILDNVGCENPQDLLQLQHLFKGGSSGSRVLVTTRSQQTAKLLGDGSFYELQGLSDDDSWRLFKRKAFPREESTSSDLVVFGKEIIKYCANNPLAICLVGSLLYGKDNKKWSSFAKNGLHELDPSDNFFEIFKLSYNHLDSPLKSCFAYCAVFPREYRINKEMMISLWRAQGFIVPSQESQSIEDAGEEYISILLWRCFLKDVERDEYGDIISFKFHPLMHDVARAVTNNEVCAIDCITNDWGKGMLHVSVATQRDTEESFTKSRARTLLFLSGDKDGLSVSTLLDNWVCLRALDLNNSGITELPHQISKLVHLRHLDLSGNHTMKVLPKSFTKLGNLETLILLNCRRLRELPSELARLAKLKCLDLKGCDSITSMPVGIGKLTCLCKLTRFAVDLSDLGCGDVLQGLQGLAMIEGHLEIRMKATESTAYERRTYDDRSGCLMNKQNLKAIELCFPRDEREKGCQEVLMEDMCPHPNLRELWLREYKGEVLPGWATGESLAISLPNLVKIKLHQCTRLKHLPFFGKLPYLRSLSLCDLRNLEYMEENRGMRGRGAKASEIVEEVGEASFFPSLKELWLVRLYKLKGWLVPLFRDDHNAEDKSSNTSRQQLQVSLLFPCLCRLVIRGCPELIVRKVMEEYPSQSSSGNSKLLEVTIDSVKCLKYVLWTRSLPCLTELDIEYDENVFDLKEVGEVLKIGPCLSSLRILRINSCIKLSSIGKASLQHLSALEELTISNCYELSLVHDEVADRPVKLRLPIYSLAIKRIRLTHLVETGKRTDIPEDGPFSSPLPQTLRSLKLHRLPKVVRLPQWIRHLTSLQSLHIAHCKRLKTYPKPDEIPTSLTKIEISNCSDVLLSEPSPTSPRGS